MNSNQSTLDRDQIHHLLRDFFHAPIHDLETVQGGEVAQTLSFAVDGQGYILRINPGTLAASFSKEAFIYRHFASPAIPIPEIVHVGRHGELVYAISRRAPGSGLMTLSPQANRDLLPELIRTLHAIHTCDVSRWAGYGVFNDAGQGTAESWRKHLAAIIEEDPADGFFGRWHELFSTTFLDRDFFETVYHFMLGLLDACPEDRWLVHGDFGFNNVLAEGGRITAVLDWINAQYGDFVYDIAWVHFWMPQANFPALVRDDYTSQGMALPNYEDRIACYQAYIGLNAMRFYAKVQNEQAYQYTAHVLKGIMAR